MAWGAYRAKAESNAVNHYFVTWSVRKKLLLSLIPSVLLILVVAGYVTNWFSTRYLNQALQRTAQVQNLAQTREAEQLLEYYRLAMLSLAQQPPDRDHFRAGLERWGIHHPGAVKELVFVGVNSSDTVLLVQTGDKVVEIEHDQYNFIKGSPVAQALKQRGLKPGACAVVGVDGGGLSPLGLCPAGGVPHLCHLSHDHAGPGQFWFLAWPPCAWPGCPLVAQHSLLV